MLEVNECLLQWKSSSEYILCTAADQPNQTWWMAAWTRRENQFEDDEMWKISGIFSDFYRDLS